MRSNKNISIVLWVLTLFGVFLLVRELQSTDERVNEPEKEVDISDVLDELQSEAEALFADLLPVEFNTTQANKAFALKKKSWYLVGYEYKKADFWNSNKFGVDISVKEINSFPIFYTFGDDFYVLFAKDHEFYLAYRLANDGNLTARIISDHPELRSYSLKLGNQKQYQEIGHLKFTYRPETKTLTWLIILGIFICLLILFFAYLKQKQLLPAAVMALLIVALDLYTYFRLSANDALLDALYQPEVYANSDLLSSLGVLLNHAIAFIPVVFLFRFFSKKYGNNLVFYSVSIVLLIFSADMVWGVTRSLVLDSNISFNFQDLYGISIFTFVAISLIGLMLFELIVFTFSIQLKDRIRSWKGVLIALLACLFFIVFQSVDASRPISTLWFPISIVLMLYCVQLLVRQTRIRIFVLFFWVVAIGTILIQKYQAEREYRFLHLYAHQLVANQDLRAEYILKSFEDKLAEEFLVPEDYSNFEDIKDRVENRIKRLYFSNYLEKYELRLISFDSLGVNINSNTLYSYDDLNTVYNEYSKRTVSNYFYQITDPKLFSGYIAKYENCDLNGHYGATFILLQPRVIQSDFLYPEAFENQTQKALFNNDEYSYGIYYNDRLISQRGNFSYGLNQAPEVHYELAWLHMRGFHHYHFDDIDKFKVVLSKKENSFTSFLSTFTFAFLLLLPLGVVLIVSSFLFDPSEQSFLVLKGRYLSTRIQVSLTLILLVGLLLSVYIIINYISANYNARLEKQLLDNVKNISARFQNKVDLELKLKNEEQRQLILNEESSAYKIDLNLFDDQGRLISTTKPYLIQDQVLAQWMNPKAFEKLKVNNFSQLLLAEELEGSEYLSAYVPLFNGKNEVIAYLNIPYFAKNAELNKQISTVIVNIINIYFLLLLGGVVVALFISKRISKPLHLIRQRFAETELGVRNELITYNRDDEIGQLVKQYNKMVLELEHSAERLAETEREGAWREMAKQVAHEIKNPLTPMKLSIQHLQRAYERGGDKLDALFAKTSALLIEQIDSLSNMASEFSNFAKMPKDQYQEVILSEVVTGVVELFKRTENIKINRRIEEGVRVYADPDQIQRVFNNLIKNGIQAIPEDREGIIEVTLTTKGNKAVCTVADNGKGIAKELQKKVFVPNFSTKTSGMGLGLAISKKIIEAADGSISLESELNKGSSFTVIMPLYEA